MPDDNLSRWIRQGRLGSCQCQISLAVCIGHPGSLRSAVKLLVLRHLLVGTHIERRALVGKQPAAEGKIVAERVAHEIHGVEVPVLEIHRMHLIALRPVYDASDLGPDRASSWSLVSLIPLPFSTRTFAEA